MDKDEEKETSSTEDYIKIIAELKQNTVPKEEYEKLKKERSDLLRAWVDGQEIPDNQSPERKEKIKELREKLFSEESELNNLEYIQTALSLREALMQEGYHDPFAPYGSKIASDEQDLAAAQRVADVLSQCVEFANGDSEIFTNELQRRMVDVSIRKRASR